jgi:hypothetical protein
VTARRLVVLVLVAVCTALDAIPSARDSIRVRRVCVSGYGCRLHLAELSDRLDQRWGTGVWSTPHA